NAGYPVYTVLLLNMLYRLGPGQSSPKSHFHIFVGAQAGPPAAAVRLLPDRILRHLVEVIAYISNDIPRFFKEAHGPGWIAGVMEGDSQMVIPAGVQLQFAAADQISGKFGDMDHPGGFRIFK